MPTHEALTLIHNLSTQKVWDYLLDFQIDLNFEEEKNFIIFHLHQLQDLSVLEIGSGNGRYLYEVSQALPGSKCTGMDFDPHFVNLSEERYPSLFFTQGNAEERNEQLIGKFDVVIFRLVLQHLEHPYEALKHAYHYLKPQGRIFIIDASDTHRLCYPPLETMKKGVKELNLFKAKKGQGDRKITLRILQDLTADQGPLKNLYKVVASSVDENDQWTYASRAIYRSDKDKEIYFHQILLFLVLLKKVWQLPVNIKEAYQELILFLKREDSYFSPGFHWLCLAKK